MLASPVQWLETLKDTIDDERIILIPNSNQVSMALSITGKGGRTIGLGYIDADWVARDTLDNLVQLKILE